MANTTKIRNLIEPDGKDISWQDIMLKCVELSTPLRELEYTSKKSDLKEAKKIFKEVERMMKQFKLRIGKEVTESVENIHRLKGGNYRGNPDALIEFRKNNIKQ